MALSKLSSEDDHKEELVDEISELSERTTQYLKGENF